MTSAPMPEGTAQASAGHAGALGSRMIDKARLLALVREKRELFDRAGRQNPFAGSAWVLNFIEHFAQDDWAIALAHDQADGESLLPLYSPPGSPGRLDGLCNPYTALYTPVVSSARDREGAIRRLVDQLVEEGPPCAAVRLSPMDRDCPDNQALERAFARRGWYVKRYLCAGNWHLPCAGLGFEEYMKSRDSRVYNTWQRKAKKFRGNGEARLQLVTGGDGLEAALDAYELVYNRSWKKGESRPEFVRDWARICAREGWLRLGLAWVGETPVAAQFWFTLDGRANIYKLAYDEAYSPWSAGTVLTAFMFEHSLEADRVREIDYLSGDDPYKRSWMSHRRQRVGLLACNPRTPRGLIMTAVEFAGEMRQRWRQFTQPELQAEDKAA